MGVIRDLKSPSEAAKEPAKEFGQSSTRVKTTEAIVAKPISMVPPVEVEVLKIGKKSKSTLAMRPAITDIGKPEQPKKEPTKESSDASMII